MIQLAVSENPGFILRISLLSHYENKKKQIVSIYRNYLLKDLNFIFKRTDLPVRLIPN